MKELFGALLTDIQNLFSVLPDPLKAASIVILIGLTAAVALPLTLALWQLFLDRFFPLAGEKFRVAVRECYGEKKQ